MGSIAVILLCLLKFCPQNLKCLASFRDLQFGVDFLEIFNIQISYNLITNRGISRKENISSTSINSIYIVHSAYQVSRNITEEEKLFLCYTSEDDSYEGHDRELLEIPTNENFFFTAMKRLYCSGTI